MFHLFKSKHIDVAYVIARSFRVLIVRWMLEMTTGIVPCLEDPRQTTNPKTPKPHYSCIPYTHINKEKLHSANNVLRKLNTAAMDRYR